MIPTMFLSEKAGYDFNYVYAHKNEDRGRYPGRIILQARNGLHTIDLSSEWNALCYLTWLICNCETTIYQKSWRSIVEAVKNSPRGFESGSGSQFLENLAQRFIDEYFHMT